MRKTNWLIILLFLFATVNSWAQVGSVIWQEDFNTLNTSIWNVVTGDGTGTPAGAGWGNQELEYYNTPNVYIAAVPGESGNNALVLEAKAQAMGTRAFTSGKVTSSDKLSVKYGLIEMRVRVPNLQTGLWPATWLLGTANAGWPGKGEIDMMEMGHNIAERTRQGFPNAAINNFAGSNLIFYSAAAVSTGNPTGAASTAYDVNYDNPYVAATALNDRFVLYRMYWSSTAIRFTVVDNGVETDLYASPFSITTESDEFQNPFYFLLNLAVGGTFTDATSNGQVTAPLPGKMYVDYIKVSKWNNQGEVTLGGPAAKTGTFGIFTDNTATSDKLVAGTSSDIWAWNNLSAGTTAAYEGSNVIAWATTAANTWFGGGIQARQPTNMSNFAASGNLKFRIKIPANVAFKVGMTDNYTNEKYIAFPANTNQYGLTRDGNWGQVTIPISAFAGTMAFQNMNYLFAIVNADGTTPASTFQMALDDIYWEGGGGTTVAVTGVSMSPTSASVAVGATSQLTATVAPSNATNKNVTWSSSNTAIATVSTSGLVTGVAAGSATITVTTQDGAKTATSAITVTAANVAVTGVTVSPTSASIVAGATQQLTATVAPSNATNKNVTWSSNNTAIATVSSSGLVTGVAAGSATITVTTQDGAKTATSAITVTASNVAVTGVTVSPTTASIVAGATQQLTATVAPSNATVKTVTWSSSNTAIATVNSSGLVTGVAAGSATITVTTTSGAKTATCAITVTAANVAVTGVTVSPTSASLAVGATQQLTATVAPANATVKTVTWSSSNTAIATVNSSGLVTGVAAGSATITVTTTSGAKTATSAITVTASATNLALNKATTVSSTESAAYPGSAAVDGNGTTRWSSAFSDPQWIYVDLGASYNVNRVKITWEPAYGKDYTVQVSANASTWTTIKTITGNTALVNDHTSLSGTGRYVRINGTARGTVYGYSIYELEVYGTVANTGCTVVSTSGDYSAAVSNATSNPTITFTPSRTGVGSPTCILYYGTSATGVLPGYVVTPNAAYTITASAGQVIYFYYTYSVPEGGEKNTNANRNSFTVGSCSTLKSATTDISDVENNSLSAFPVPMGNILNVKINSAIYNHVTITDLNGRVILSQVISSDISKLDVNNLKKGIYCLRVEGKSAPLSKMIVK